MLVNFLLYYVTHKQISSVYPPVSIWPSTIRSRPSSAISAGISPIFPKTRLLWTFRIFKVATTRFGLLACSILFFRRGFHSLTISPPVPQHAERWTFNNESRRDGRWNGSRYDIERLVRTFLQNKIDFFFVNLIQI